jgi:hypothetical protein
MSESEIASITSRSAVAVTSPSASSVTVADPKRIVAVYVLSAPTRYVNSLVDVPTPKTNNPVAIGSSVPACPTLRVPRAFRAAETTP